MADVIEDMDDWHFLVNSIGEGGSWDRFMDHYQLPVMTIRRAMRLLIWEMREDGTSWEEFEHGYPLARAQRETGGPWADWYAGLDLPGRFEAILERLRVHTTVGQGKTHLRWHFAPDEGDGRPGI